MKKRKYQVTVRMGAGVWLVSGGNLHINMNLLSDKRRQEVIDVLAAHIAGT